MSIIRLVHFLPALNLMFRLLVNGIAYIRWSLLAIPVLWCLRVLYDVIWSHVMLPSTVVQYLCERKVEVIISSNKKKKTSAEMKYKFPLKGGNIF